MKPLDELDALHAAATAGPRRMVFAVRAYEEWHEFSARLRAAEALVATADAVAATALERLKAQHAEVERLRGEVAAATTPRPLDEWHDDDGVVLWWRLPVNEPPYVGTPLDEDFPDYVTHWTKVLVPEEP